MAAELLVCHCHIGVCRTPASHRRPRSRWLEPCTRDQCDPPPPRSPNALPVLALPLGRSPVVHSFPLACLSLPRIDSLWAFLWSCLRCLWVYDGQSMCIDHTVARRSASGAGVLCHASLASHRSACLLVIQPHQTGELSGLLVGCLEYPLDRVYVQSPPG